MTVWHSVIQEQHPAKRLFSRTPIADMEAEQIAIEAKARAAYQEQSDARCGDTWDELPTRIKRRWCEAVAGRMLL